MNGNFLSSWYVRAGLVALGTYFALKHLPLGATGKTAVLAIGAVSTAGIVASNMPMVAQLLSGNVGAVLPASTAQA